MAVNFSFEVLGEEVLQRNFRTAGEVVEDFSPEWKEMQTAFHEIEADLFQSGGATGESGKWADVTEATEAFKIREYGTAALFNGAMIASGDTYESLTKKTQNSIFETSRNEMEIGTSLPYPKFHMKPRGKRPARKVIDITQTQKDDMARRFIKSVKSRIKRSTGLTMTEDNFRDAF